MPHRLKFEASLASHRDAVLVGALLLRGQDDLPSILQLRLGLEMLNGQGSLRHPTGMAILHAHD
jgi:hypothetical protein